MQELPQQIEMANQNKHANGIVEQVLMLKDRILEHHIQKIFKWN